MFEKWHARKQFVTTLAVCILEKKREIFTFVFSQVHYDWLKPSICVMSNFSLFKLKKGKIFVWKIKISLKILHLVYCFLSQTNKKIEISIPD